MHLVIQSDLHIRINARAKLVDSHVRRKSPWRRNRGKGWRLLPTRSRWRRRRRRRRRRGGSALIGRQKSASARSFHVCLSHTTHFHTCTNSLSLRFSLMCQLRTLFVLAVRLTSFCSLSRSLSLALSLSLARSLSFSRQRKRQMRKHAPQLRPRAHPLRDK